MRNYFIDKLCSYNVLTDEAVSVLQNATSRSKTVPSGHHLIREGDRPDFLFIVLEGWAMRYKILPNGIRQVLAFLMPGDCCDIRSELLAEADHSIMTLTTATIVSVGHADIEQIISFHTSIAKAMYITQLIDHASTRALVTSLGRRNSHERVCHLILELYARARNVGLTTNNELDLPVSQIVLADALGLTSVHLNRVVKVLRKDGLIVLKGRSLTILNMSTLVQISGFDENFLHRRVRRAA